MAPRIRPGKSEDVGAHLLWNAIFIDLASKAVSQKKRQSIVINM